MVTEKPAKKRVASWVVTDDFWARVEPLVPVRERPAGKEYTRKARWAQTEARAAGIRSGCLCVAYGLPVESAAEGTLRQRQRDPQAVPGMGACRRIRGDLGGRVSGIRPDGRYRLAMAKY